MNFTCKGIVLATRNLSTLFGNIARLRDDASVLPNPAAMEKTLSCLTERLTVRLRKVA